MYSNVGKYLKNLFVFMVVFSILFFSCRHDKKDGIEQEKNGVKVEIENVKHGKIICKDINKRNFKSLDNVEVALN